jgi:hypothetical protein
VIANTVPLFGSAAIVPDPANDRDILTVVTGGWTDADGDPEGYRYQWTKNGAAIAGATSSTLAGRFVRATNTITCIVTAWDGANEGNTIETAPVVVQGERSAVRDWRLWPME